LVADSETLKASPFMEMPQCLNFLI
jgi:hypothetical protein